MGCMTSTESNKRTQSFSAEKTSSTVGGVETIQLRSKLKDPQKLQILSAEILPGRGMNVFKIRGHVPGKGEVDLLHSRDLGPGENKLGPAEEDFNGNLAFKEGGAILVPFANRIRGQLSKDGQTLTTTVAGKKVQLPANWKGKKPGAEKHAMHGLILDSKVGDLKLTGGESEAAAQATLEAGDFGGHWPSKTRLNFQYSLKDAGLTIKVTATNVGQEQLPIGIGWHPYFNFPSGDRRQARLVIPAKTRLLVNNYDDVFPTGGREGLEGPYAFYSFKGAALLGNFLDDCFTDLVRGADGVANAEILDPAARFGLRIRAVSPQIKAFQVYAPPEKNFVAVEPQFNLADPYNKKIWKATDDTGMVLLKPGESVTYEVALELFSP